jgi:formylglycine-generating enzyme required for sulfatase activity
MTNPAAPALPDLRTVQHWLDRCIAHLQQQYHVSARREYRRTDFAHLPLNDLRVRLSLGLVHAPLPAEYVPEQLPTLAAQLTAAALWRLIADPYLTELYWYQPLAVLSSTALARRARQTYRQYIQHYTPHAASAPDQDTLFANLVRDLASDEALSNGMLVLLDDLRDPAHGRPLLAQAIGAARRQHSAPESPVAPRVPAEPLPADQPVPLTPGQWRYEVEHRKSQYGHVAGYWCYIRPARYSIGGWNGEMPGQSAESAHVRIRQGFWVARFPITRQQFAVFAQTGYQDDARDWWTPHGWQWRVQHPDQAAWAAGADAPDTPDTLALPALVTWYEARAFARWITARLAGILPNRMVLRLPTEAEWEIAAACDARGSRHTYPWGNQERAHPDPAYVPGQPRPVGAPAALPAACGAVEMTGSVWQWTASEAARYPTESDMLLADPAAETALAIRGGGADRRCGVREQALPTDGAALRLVLTRNTGLP